MDGNNFQAQRLEKRVKPPCENYDRGKSILSVVSDVGGKARNCFCAHSHILNNTILFYHTGKKMQLGISFH
jgi:hypothetical protein